MDTNLSQSEEKGGITKNGKGLGKMVRKQSIRRKEWFKVALLSVCADRTTGFSRVNGVGKGMRTMNRNPNFSAFQKTKECDNDSLFRCEMSNNGNNIPDEVDVVVVGSGIGGLSAAAMCSLYGYSVAVLESHSVAGGCAHGYTARDKDGNSYQFDTGPSFFSGLGDYAAPSSASVNPLRTVLDAVDESVACEPYTTFGLSFPEGNFLHTSNYTNLMEQWFEEQNQHDHDDEKSKVQELK